MIGSYRGIIFRLTHNFCALHFVQIPQLCGHLAVIAGQRQTKGLQHKAGVPFPCLILIGCSLLQPLQNQTRAGFSTAIQGVARCRPQLPGGGAKSRQKLAAPRRVSGPPHGTGNCAPTLTSNTSKASSASMGSQVAPGWTPPPGHGHTILPVLLIEICLIFFDQRHTLGHAVTAAQRVCVFLNAKSKSWPTVVEATCRRVSLAA